ncbi:hypothetical protein BDW02DRAFT_78426 [Decorospora gaudefroyi]|uniref:F-box domain-containing protein n=1 Tax=Decorospora gaudefroyi TaxID=184978 RepID=A0A6A5K8H1_9PLEO|nr:hypothetical protein BDW02DRAFT_78426 [Decorospora gaudefroyi]
MQPPDPFIALANGRCPLLSLPRELRDMIYAYVVEKRGEVRMHKNSCKTWKALVYCESKKQWVEVDRLQDVCKQLRTETEERGVRFDQVAFERGTLSTGTDSLERFIRDDSRRARLLREPTLQIHSYIRKIVGYHNVSCEAIVLDYFSQLYSIAGFCDRNPQVVVIVRFHCPNEDPWTWLALHYAYRSLLRGPPLEIPDLVRPYLQQCFPLGQLPELSGRRSIPLNHRLTLTNTFGWQREDFRTPDSPESKDEVDEMMVVARKMFSEGV